MPKNTTQMGNSGWQQFVFEGTTPRLIAPVLAPESRIELAVTKATNVVTAEDSFAIHKGDTLIVNHITYENNLSTNNFMISQLRSTDISNTLPSIVSQQEDNSTVNGGTILEKTYSDNSRDLLVYNPKQNTVTIRGITSNAKVWLLHADTTGNWSIANLFNAANSPSFSGFSTTPTVVFHNRTTGTGGQYEITF